MSPLDLTPQDLLKLSDADLREMIRRLCEAELTSQNLPTSAVLAGGAQEAADGGLDVVVKLNPPLKAPNFIPRPYTGFQVKKHGMTPQACQNEMLYHSKAPKSVIRELAAASGAYIMVTTDNCSDSMLKNRLDSMQKAVSTLPNHDQIFLDFYGIDRLNQWLSLFPGTQLWVRERIGRPLTSWQSHGRWTTVPTEDNDAYITDKQPHITDISEGQVCKIQPFPRRIPKFPWNPTQQRLKWHQFSEVVAQPVLHRLFLCPPKKTRNLAKWEAQTCPPADRALTFMSGP